MRKLVAIASVGIAAVAITVYFGRSAETSVAPASERTHPRTPTDDASATMASADSARRASTGRENSPQVSAPLTDEEQQQAACDAMWERKRKREQAAHDAELKDPNWAYAMEQKLREYTSRKFQSSQIQVMGIDCKTTFCELRAEGFAPETSEEFNKVIGAVREESWNDFTGLSTSHNEESGKTIHTAEVSRKPSTMKTREERNDEQAEPACIALMSQRTERARAARDEEPRDASWADPMEQLLRQHITTRSVSHPVDHLDVSCKTTFCRIKATGRTMDSYRVFQKVAQEAAAEPWSDLRAGGEGGGGSYGEFWKQEYTLYRDL